MRKAIDLFTPGGRQRVLDGRYIVQGVPIRLEHTDACYDQTLVHARLPGDMQESWGTDIKLPTHFKTCTVEQLDEAVKSFFDRFPDPFAPCPTCGQQTWNRKRFPTQYRDERCGDCWFTAFREKMARWSQEQQDTLHSQDVQQYHLGMRWRSTAIVHPATGDDTVVDIYTVEKPTPEGTVAVARKRHPTAVKIEPTKPIQLKDH